MKHAIICETLSTAWVVVMVAAAVLLGKVMPSAEFFWTFMCGMFAMGGGAVIRFMMEPLE